MLLELDQSQLVLIDYQSKLMPSIFDGANVLTNAILLTRMATSLGAPVWATEENPSGLGQTVPELSAHFNIAGCRTLKKMHFSAVEEGLADWLRPEPPQSSNPVRGNARSLPRHLQKPQVQAAASRNAVVIAGCEAHVCLLQTALDLLEDDFEVWVVTDACGSRTERNRDAAFDRLAGAGAELVTTEMVAFEWLRTAEHAAFKEILSMLK